MIRIAVAGISGRMGAAVAQEVLKCPQCQLTLVTSRNPQARCGLLLAVAELSADFDVLIDFSLPAAAIKNLEFCLEHGKPMVIGATGFTDAQLAKIQAAAKVIPLLKSNNMSMGANACDLALAQICSLLDESWQITLEESHHQDKRDAPSGTALMFVQTIQDNGMQPASIKSIRDQSTIGVHKITFTNADEYLELQHVALSRATFSHGALLAAKWLVQQTPSLYNMHNLQK